MSWHYQIRKRLDKGQRIFEIVELYVNANGTAFGQTHDAITPSGETAEELIADLANMLADAKKYAILVDLPDTEEDV